MADEWKSDLFCESTEFFKSSARRGGDMEELVQGNLRIIRWNPTEGQRAVTVQTPSLWQLDQNTYGEICQCLAAELGNMMRMLLGEKESCSVLAVGLGNPSLTTDALGPETVKRLAVTLPVREKKGYALSAFVPDVVGNTGIETAELIRGIVNTVHPDLVLAVDALAAKNSARLATVIQLSDGGISPGSGLGNRRREISRRTLGVPVVAMGIPTVVPSSALMADALERARVPSQSDDVRSLLEEGRRLLVTPKEIDLIVQSTSFLLSDAIHRACGMGT